MFRNVADKIIIPFFWIEDGYSRPSDEIVAAVKGGDEDGEDLKIEKAFCPKYQK